MGINFFLYFFYKAGKITLFYKDQPKQIMSRFIIWGIVMVSLIVT